MNSKLFQATAEYAQHTYQVGVELFDQEAGDRTARVAHEEYWYKEGYNAYINPLRALQ
jgi:hypothetical protein